MRKNVLKSTCAALAAVVMVSGFWMSNQNQVDTSVPQLVTYVDSMDGTITIEGEETPLAAKPVVKKKTTTKKKTQKIKMPTKAKKSSKKTTKKTVKTSNTKTSSTQKVKTDTTVLTTAVTSLKKNSKVKTIKTTVKTTTKTTTTKITAPKKTGTAATTGSGSKNTVVKKTVAVRSIAPKAHANVLSAYEKMGFAVKVDSTVNFSGKFDAKTQSITIQKNSDEAIYHELGHFVAFVAGNVDQTAEFKAIYDKEKAAFKGTRNNDAYIKSSAPEYFAESYQDYVERPEVLKSARPQTYKFIADSVSKVTDARASFLVQLYANIWK